MKREGCFGICLVLMSALCLTLLSGCGDIHAREYRKLLRELEKIRDKAAYSDNYGNEIMNLISRFVNTDIKRAELQRIISEALLVNPYILNLSEFKFSQIGSKMTIEFTVQTVYGIIDYTQGVE